MTLARCKSPPLRKNGRGPSPLSARRWNLLDLVLGSARRQTAIPRLMNQFVGDRRRLPLPVIFVDVSRYFLTAYSIENSVLTWIPVAARKLKCDGQPICSNCSRRGIACAYAPEARRRGPGKAPKGQKKLARERTQATAGPSGVAQGSLSPPTRGRSRGRRSAQRVASSSTQSHLSQQQPPEGQPPPSFGSGDSSYDFNFEQTSTPPEPMTNPTSAEQYRRIFNLPPGFSDYQPQQSTSYTSLPSRMASGPSSGMPWASASPSSASTGNVQPEPGTAMGDDPGRQEHSAEGSSPHPAPYHQHEQPRRGTQGQAPHHGRPPPPAPPHSPR